LPLRYASAVDLARVLQPFVGTGAKIVADPASNVLLVSGEPGERATLAGLVQAFDTDILAGQSYALLPVPEGAAKDFTASLQEAFRAQGNAGLAGIVRVVPLDRINSVLVIAPQGRYIDDARRVYALIERQRRLTVRSWHVYYLQDSNAQDAAYALQQAFTPNAVTATPSTSAGSQTAPGRGMQQASSAGSGAGIGGAGSGIGAGISLTGGGGGLGTGTGAVGGAPAAGAPPTQAAANPLLGGLDTSGGGVGGGGTGDTNTMRIIPNPQNNALLIYATQQEEETIEAMLRKIDILPLQVRIDATIAEVTLNDQLQYGTQFFFKSGGVNAILNNTAQTTPVGTVANTVLATTFPGFVIGGPGQGGAPLALQALQAVTTVHVLSSPELLVLDNQTARLQVGDLVPYLTSSSQNTAANSAVINSVNYQPTGVIMNVTPRVNNGGVVTLDISQEVSGIDTTVPITTTGIASPTFSERSVTSRVVVQSGQTIGLAGLITDNISRGNSGIPFLKDIPLLGFLTGTQNNQRTRTELLVLITPHVLYDQRDARALTEDLQQQLPNAAAVPAESRMLRASGSNDPGQSVRRALQLH
jgi:general secretion pathway protein D